MSKAFTKEDDDSEPEKAEINVNVKINYVTPKGLASLQAEYRQLLFEERPRLVETVHWAASNGDRSENGDYIYGKRRLREIDRRVRYLTKQIQAAKVVDPALQQGLTKIFFGATVTYANAAGEKTTVTIVGVDEADLKQDKISWTSPVAKALMKASAGDSVSFKTPSGTVTLTILHFDYA